MTFPTTPALDVFNSGPNQLLTAAGRSGWSNSQIWTSGTASTDSVPTYAWASPGGACEAVWATSFGSDQEGWFIFGSTGHANGTVSLYIRIQAFYPALTAYYCTCSRFATSLIGKTIGGSNTQLSSSVAYGAPSAGDGIGFSAVGTTLTSWLNTGGVWTVLESITDSSITGAASIGFDNNTPTNFIDSFGGGTVILAPGTPARRSAVRRS